MRKPDIVLVNPPFSLVDTLKSEEQHSEKDQFYKYPPLGIAYLASSLSSSGYVPSIIDGQALTIEETIRRIREMGTTILGITVTTHTMRTVKLLIEQIKKIKQYTVIVGGPHITFDPEAVGYLGADFGINGEGEYAIQELVGALVRKKKSIENIKGLIYSKNGKIITNKRVWIEDLDSLPPPMRELLPENEYYFSIHGGKFTTVIASRGCAYNCIYCALPDRSSVRMRSVENVIEELQELTLNEYSYIDFQDDFFTHNQDWVKRLCRMIIDRKLRFSWGCATRIGHIDLQLLRLMRKAGCHNIRYGLESGSVRVRDQIGKSMPDSLIKKTIVETKRAGIKPIGFFSLGHPTETYADMVKTKMLAKSLPLDYIQFAIISILPGSKLYSHAIEEGIITPQIWEQIASGERQPPSYIPKGVQLSQMKNIQRKALISYYLNPLYSIRNLSQATDWKDLKNKMMIGGILIRDFLKK